MTKSIYSDDKVLSN
jgi:hypothetical protein